MNTYDWERELSTGLDRHVRDLHDTPLSLDAVKGRAGRIRRRRQATAAGALLGAAAIVTPFALQVGGDTAAPAPVTPATSVPDDDAAASVIGVPYLEAGTLHTPDGQAHELPSAAYTEASDLGGRVVAYRTDDRGFGFIDVVVDGEVVDTWEAANPFVATDSGESIAYLTREGELVTAWGDGELSLGEDFGESAFPVEITGGPSCEPEADQCLVVLDFGDGETEPMSVTSKGIRSAPVPGALSLDDLGPDGLATVQTDWSAAGSCNGIYDRDTTEYVRETCDFAFGALSPDGRHVIATDAYGDGQGPLFFEVQDLQGNLVARYAPEGGFIRDIAWEDDGHVVATVYDGAGWHVVRQPLADDEGLEYVLGPVRASEDDDAFRLTGGAS